jgi:hypothetical protein
MNDVTAKSEAMDANQRYLVAEFTRLGNRLTGVAGPEADDTERCGARAALPGPAAIEVLTACFGLSAFERDILLLCAGVEMHAELSRACAEAAGTPARTMVTFGLALKRLEGPHWSAVMPIAPLRRWRLIEVDETAGLTSGRIRIDERILHYVAGLNYLDLRLRPLLRHRQPVHAMAEGQGALAATLVTTLHEEGAPPPVIMLAGDDVEGQGDVAANVGAELGLQLYSLDADALPANAAEREALGILWQREARLLNAALLVEVNDRDARKHVPDFVDRLSGLVFVAGRELPALSRATLRVEVNKPEAPDRRTLWMHALGPAATRLNGSVDAIAAQFRLSARRILATGREIQQELAGGEQDEALLWRTCQRAGRAKLDELAHRIDSPTTWEALVLPAPQIATLHQIGAHVRHRLAVYHDWGFATRSTRGLGITALFAGESGTGKTMAAEVLANELHLDLYRIDLSSVVSKYIGETEKNLRRVFDAAEDSGAVLLFDEADALFGKRSEVRDSHDRYANIEVSYLLQRMEAYRGLAILTTNMKASLDSAFQRRLRFVVQFPFPDLTQREAIWRAIFPPATPVENLDFAKLARVQMAGGNIRNVALNAAFLAAQAHAPVQMRHLLHAAQSEAAKRERPLSDGETKGWV